MFLNEKEKQQWCRHHSVRNEDIYEEVDGVVIDATIQICNKCNKEL